jgi:hypothetical protein
MANHQISITKNGTTTLATAGTWNDRDIDIHVSTEPPNILSTAIDENGNIFNGIGYKNGARLQGSTGNEMVEASSFCTGFIAVDDNTFFVLKNAGFGHPSIYCSVIGYTDNHTDSRLSGYGYIKPTFIPIWEQASVAVFDEGSLIAIVNKNPTVKYIRISGTGDGANVILNRISQ